jgi:serine/threonine protein phosphatase PrpC
VGSDSKASRSNVAVSALSDIGAVRDHNEDSVVVGAWTVCGSVVQVPQTLVFTDHEPLVVAVADGLGGHPAGEVASAVVVEMLARSRPLPENDDELRELVQACNHAVYDEAMHNPDRAGMGTTISGVVLREDATLVFNVGDSRVYIFDGHDLVLATIDDNPPLAPGQTHTAVLTQMLGGHAAPRDVDVHAAGLPRPEGARYLVCTDGLSDVVSEDQIKAILREHEGEQAVHELWQAAMNAGGPDNITLALVESLDR